VNIGPNDFIKSLQIDYKIQEANEKEIKCKSKLGKASKDGGADYITITDYS
jgi:hypothetical protein